MTGMKCIEAECHCSVMLVLTALPGHLQMSLEYFSVDGTGKSISQDCNALPLRESVYIWKVFEHAAACLPLFVPVEGFDEERQCHTGGTAQVCLGSLTRLYQSTVNTPAFAVGAADLDCIRHIGKGGFVESCC